MHTIRVEITPAEAIEFEDQLLVLSNELGRPLGFSIQKEEKKPLALVGYFKSKKTAAEELRLLGLDKKVTHGFLKDRDWQLCMRNHFEPLYYRGIAWVPTWQKKLKKARHVLKFDPEMAFGSGNHPTTRLCLRRLVELMSKNDKATVLDLGCGSGILAITADRLGAKAVGIDYDPEAVIVSKRNAKLNKSKAIFKIGDVYKDKLPRADIVLANLLGNIITDNARKLWGCVNPGGVLILSGLLKEELPAIAKLFPCPARLYRLGNWGAVVLRRNAK